MNLKRSKKRIGVFCQILIIWLAWAKMNTHSFSIRLIIGLNSVIDSLEV